MTKRALIVGSETGGLSGVLHDAREIGKRLETRGFVLDVRCGVEASRASILEALERLARNTTTGEAAVFYYSGQGATYVNESGKPELPRLLRCLVPSDVDATGAYAGIWDVELATWLGQLGAKTPNVTVVLDCCYATRVMRGPVSASRKVKGFLRPLDQHHETSFLDAAVRARANSSQAGAQAVRLEAAGTDQLAFEDLQVLKGATLRMGNLSWALADVLDEVGESQVSWQTVFARVRERVMARAYGQRPLLAGAADRILFEMSEGERSAYHAPAARILLTGPVTCSQALLPLIDASAQLVHAHDDQSYALAMEASEQQLVLFDDEDVVVAGPWFNDESGRASAVAAAESWSRASTLQVPPGGFASDLLHGGSFQVRSRTWSQPLGGSTSSGRREDMTLRRVAPDELKAGDILLSLGIGTISEAIQALDGGWYSHAALWTGSEIIESVDPAVLRHSLESGVHRSHRRYVDVYRRRDLDDAQRAAIVEHAGTYVGRKYAYGDLVMGAAIVTTGSFLFRTSDRTQRAWLHAVNLLGGVLSLDVERSDELLTCVELIARSYHQAGVPIRIDISGLRVYRGRQLFAALRDLVKARVPLLQGDDPQLVTQLAAFQAKLMELRKEDVAGLLPSGTDGFSAPAVVQAGEDWNPNLVTPRDLMQSGDLALLGALYP